MQTILPRPASGQPSRGRPRTTGRRGRLAPRRRRSVAGASAAGVTSLMTRDRSCSVPSASIAPGRSAPGRPYRTSFMSGVPHISQARLFSGVPDADDLADERGALLPLDLDRHLGAHAHPAAGHLFVAADALAHADARARLNGGHEPDLVRAVPAAPPPLAD